MVPAAKNFVEFVKRIDLILKLSFLHKIIIKKPKKQYKRGMRKLLDMMDMFIILIVVMVLLYLCVKNEPNCKV